MNHVVTMEISWYPANLLNIILNDLFSVWENLTCKINFFPSDL